MARIIAAAAAKHLTPLTLELGGKSPVIIDPKYDLKTAAKRILVGKTTNAGQVCTRPRDLFRNRIRANDVYTTQICIAPDYVLIHKDKQEELVKAIKDQLVAFYPNWQLNDPNYTSIISPTHFSRVTNLIRSTEGTISIDGGKDEKTLRVGTTVVTDVPADDLLMSELVCIF